MSASGRPGLSDGAVSAARRLAPSAVWLAAFAFHLFCAGGTLVPYRDAGEMVSAAHTLGVAHPPGYPAYALAGKSACQLPLGNLAYRLNLLSAAGGAFTALLIFLVLNPSAGPAAAAAAAGLWATSPIAGELAAVSEMYTWWFLGLAAVLAAAWRLLKSEGGFRLWAALSFLLGLGCGVRTDFALLGPALLYLLWRTGRLRWLLPLAGCFALGFSIFAYLPVRSAQQPWMDWNNPEELPRLVGSLLRRSHGGTLDLLSKSYAPGENFASESWIFLKSSAAAFSWAGLPLAALGAWRLARRARPYLVFLALVFAASGPAFIYLANMPPNPHAVAIVEAHYGAPQLVLLLLAGWGAGGLLARRPAAGAALLAAAVGFNVAFHGARTVKRWNLRARDYVANLARSAPVGSLGVVREDVPLFGFWERLLVARHRPDLAVVAQGLAASGWYRDMLERQGRPAALGPLRGPEDWSAFVRSNPSRALWAAGDVNLAYAGETRSAGLPIFLRGSPGDSETLFACYSLRDAADQSGQPDFFSSDLVSEYAHAALREAAARVRGRDWDGARRWLMRARRFDPEAPAAPFNLGYVSFQSGDQEGAERHYSRATRLNQELLRRAASYRSLPAVVDGLRREAAEIWVHRGVVHERGGRLDAARAGYSEALRLDPASAQAHYNLAVTYWGRDWERAVEHMRRAAELDPANRAARDFLAKAENARASAR